MIDWDDDPPQGVMAKWFSGAVVPLVFALYGLSIVVSREASMPRFRVFRPRGSLIYGADAVVYGIAVLGAAIFLHCHYFWGNTKNLAEYSVLGKMVGGVVFTGGIGWLLVRLMKLV
jgi:hypothetical protein